MGNHFGKLTGKLVIEVNFIYFFRDSHGRIRGYHTNESIQSAGTEVLGIPKSVKVVLATIIRYLSYIFT